MAVSALFRRIQLKNHSTVKEKKMKKVLQPLLVGSMFVVSFLGANAAFGQKTNTDPASRPQMASTTRHGGDSVHRKGIVNLSEIAFEGQTTRHGGDSVHRKGIVNLSEIAFEGQTTRHGGDSVHRKGIVNLSEIAFEGQTTRHGGDSVHRKGIVNLSEIAFEGETTRHGGDSVHRKGIVNLSEIAFEGQTTRHGGDSVHRKGIVNENASDLIDQTVRKSDRSLLQNAFVQEVEMTVAPNPFVAHTAITIVVASNAAVNLEVYNLQGMRVATLFEGNLSANLRQTVVLDGESMANGIYFARLTTNTGIVKQQKLVLQR